MNWMMVPILRLYFTGRTIHLTIQESVYICGNGEAENGIENWR